jgi:hypothetical protein
MHGRPLDRIGFNEAHLTVEEWREASLQAAGDGRRPTRLCGRPSSVAVSTRCPRRPSPTLCGGSQRGRVWANTSPAGCSVGRRTAAAGSHGVRAVRDWPSCGLAGTDGGGGAHQAELAHGAATGPASPTRSATTAVARRERATSPYWTCRSTPRRPRAARPERGLWRRCSAWLRTCRHQQARAPSLPRTASSVAHPLSARRRKGPRSSKV